MELYFTNRKGLSRTALQYIAAALLVLGTLATRGVLPPVFQLLSRPAAPLLAWLLVEHFFRMHDRAACCRRLWLAAVLMEAGNSVSYALFGLGGISENLFLPIAIGFGVVLLLDTAAASARRKRMRLRVAAYALFAAGMVLSCLPMPLFAGKGFAVEDGLVLLPLMLLAYLLRGSRLHLSLAYTAWCLLLGAAAYGMPALFSGGFEAFCHSSNWLGCLVVPFFWLYSGAPGHSSWFHTRFLYWFYPLHLWLMAFLLR